MLESLETSLRLYRPGTSIQEVTGEVVRIMVSGTVKLGILKGDVDELIAQNAHRPFFMHGLSHWLGLDVHDVGVYGGSARAFLNGHGSDRRAVFILRRMQTCQNSIAVSAFVLKTTL